jgi:hypothetical protein
MPKLRPREVDTPNYPKQGPQIVGFSSFEVMVLYFIYNKNAFGDSL